MAERVGVNGSYLGFVERGENVSTLTVILLLAETLEVDAGDLVREVARKTPDRSREARGAEWPGQHRAARRPVQKVSRLFLRM
jgi:hypothetical protein